MNRWVEGLRTVRERGEAAMLVTVMDVRGSAPRERGAKMLVTASEVIGTIGGGQLEFQCTRMAAERIAVARGASSCSASTGGDVATGTGDPVVGITVARGTGSYSASTGRLVQRFPLGANCGQCCGGVVEVLFESVADAAWLQDLLAFYDERVPVVLVTAFSADGKSQKFLVTAGECHGYGASTEGQQAAVASAAREMLAVRSAGAKLLRLKQPGYIPMLLEPIMSSTFNLAIFGAGHVGSAVVAAMAGLDCNIRWIDSRRDIFPPKVPANVTCLESESPSQEAAAMLKDSYYLVMTHSHPLDFEICSRILDRGDFAYCGLIGSVSKRRRFEKLMRKQGMQEAVLDRLTCPIGVAGIESKKPEAIAIAVAAELLQKHEASTAKHASSTSEVIRAL